LRGKCEYDHAALNETQAKAARKKVEEMATKKIRKAVAKLADERARDGHQAAPPPGTIRMEP
jgi:hypothetical protein